MPTYADKMMTSSPELDGQWEEFYTVYRQSFARYWTCRALDYVTLKLDKAIHKLDSAVFARWHNRTCNDDCGEWTEVATDKTVPGCRRNGLCIDIDLWLYDFSMNKRVRLGETKPVPRAKL